MTAKSDSFYGHPLISNWSMDTGNTLLVCQVKISPYGYVGGSVRLFIVVQGVRVCGDWVKPQDVPYIDQLVDARLAALKNPALYPMPWTNRPILAETVEEIRRGILTLWATIFGGIPSGRWIVDDWGAVTRKERQE